MMPAAVQTAERPLNTRRKCLRTWLVRLPILWPSMNHEDSTRTSLIEEARELMKAAWTLRRTTLAERTATEGELDQSASLIRRKLIQAVVLCHRADDPRALATALGRLGHVEHDAGRHDDAVALYEEAVAVARAATDPMLLAHAVRHFGDAHRSSGRLAEAEACYDEALALYAAEDTPSKLDYANAIRPMAILKEELGEADQARDLWQQAKALYAAVPIAAGVAECEESLTRLPPSHSRRSAGAEPA